LDQKLSLAFKFRFALAELGFTTLRATADFFLLYFYTDVVMINPALVGSALLVAKLTWDAINDPLFGYWSDRTRSRFGRRRIYMLIAALPIAIGTWIQFSIPVGLTGATAFLAVMFTFWLKDTFITMAIVPYYSMIAEVTHDYQERSSLAVFKGGAAVIGYIIGAAGITLIVGVFRSLGLDLRQAWSATAAVLGSFATITLLITTLTIKERPELAGEPSTVPPLRGILYCFKNKPFNLLMIIFILGGFAFTVQAALLPFLIQYNLGMGSQISTIMTISLLTTGLFVIPTKWLADKTDKGPTYAAGMGLAALTFLLAFIFLPHHPTPLVYVVAVALGIAFSTHWVIPYAMLPDVIEYDELMTGERREGTYFGISNFLNKFAVALGTAVPGWALAGFGYVPNAVQTGQALFGIRLFYAAVPALVIFSFLPLLIWYPITKKTHAALRQQIAGKQQSAGSAHPVQAGEEA
jgi:glycoside/pentoside/hexuronide:cation symporter, GPH family